jgi:L-threonine-O-3-phosphate decarboxylase
MKDEMQYLHGGNPLPVFTRLGIAPRPVLDFSANISPFGPPEEVIELCQNFHQEIDQYPSVEGEGVKKFYRERFGIHSNCVLPGNGATELIYLAPRALGLKRVAIVTPSFSDYARACRLAGADIIELRLSPSEQFSSFALDVYQEALQQADALLLGNPNNPTGTLFPSDTLLKIAGKFPEKFIIIDESFVQFLDHWRETTLFEQAPDLRNVLVLHSLTKFYALAGLRIGAAFGHRDTISRLRAFKEPWTVNRIAEKAATALLDAGEYEKTLQQLVHDERIRIVDACAKLSNIKIYTPTANFVLARWTATDNLDDLLRALLADGLYVRDCRNFEGLQGNYFRFAIRHHHENDRLLSSIAKCV